ncbi:very low-density lipoprotein receptor-like isoform X2 [Lineus longissimus]|uniref:very low-density lipoprotein receptor-like isoform X2 n=1 Tax=Lineus longissimus TaxID=88925 RepID=UPI002B4F314C
MMWPWSGLDLVSLGLVILLFHPFVYADLSQQCVSSEFQCTSGKCIPISWKCDGSPDCSDGLDEQECTPKTCSTEEFRCANGRCIPARWRCDGQDDCVDASDERSRECASRNCSSDTFSCGDGGCVPKTWHCDGQKDCKNGRDELNCQAQKCTTNQFACNNGDCIVARWRCDGDPDCEDESDEHDCAPKTCAPTEFHCVLNNTCIPGRWKCDGDKDCGDGSDESDCKKVVSACSPQDFMCQTSKDCIHKSWRCDGERDCHDNSDESGCENTCRPDQFKCKNNECIHGNLYCNGFNDCADSSDESNCNTTIKPPCDKFTHFDCYNNGKKCIPLTKVCDKNNDCGGNEDEKTKICKANPCAFKNGNCSQHCKNTHTSDICYCDPGFELGVDKRTCVDIDECKLLFGACSQKCSNLPGTYHCTCDQPGYEIDLTNKHNCKVSGSVHPYLIFSDRHVIRKLDVHNGRTSVVVKETDSAIAMDYHWGKSMVFWTDSANEKIYSSPLVDVNNGEVPNRNDWKVVASNVSTPDGIAVDWVHHLIFWTDTGKNTIEVAKLDGSMRTHLIYEDLDEPRDIVVDPLGKYIYWTDWAENHPRIEKCGINGYGRKAIITTGLQWPNGLTIDFVKKWLYWVDAKMHMIGSADLDGNNQRTILSAQGLLKHPFSIAVFEDRVYWSDWEHEAIKSVDKFTGNNTQSHAIHLFGPMDVHVLHPLKQPQGENVCEATNGGCSHLCLPAPVQAVKFTCHCPINFRLLSDFKQCVPISDTTVAPSTAQSNATINSSRTAGLPEDFGRVAGIVIGVVLVVLIIVFIVGFVLYRQYTRRNVKSMNFDNPVYRKTTEEQVNLDKGVYQPSRPLPATLEPLNQPDSELNVV